METQLYPVPEAVKDRALIDKAGYEAMYARSVEDLEQVAVAVDAMGTPVLLKNIANIQIGPELRRGVLD